jgi:hypothetical protein
MIKIPIIKKMIEIYDGGLRVLKYFKRGLAHSIITNKEIEIVIPNSGQFSELYIVATENPTSKINKIHPKFDLIYIYI